MTITVSENSSSITFSDSAKTLFGSDLVLFNPSLIDFLFKEISEKTPNKLENLPDIPNYVDAEFKNQDSTANYGVTSEFMFKKFVKELKKSLDLITLGLLSKQAIAFLILKVS